MLMVFQGQTHLHFTQQKFSYHCCQLECQALSHFQEKVQFTTCSRCSDLLTHYLRTKDLTTQHLEYQFTTPSKYYLRHCLIHSHVQHGNSLQLIMDQTSIVPFGFTTKLGKIQRSVSALQLLARSSMTFIDCTEVLVVTLPKSASPFLFKGGPSKLTLTLFLQTELHLRGCFPEEQSL